MMSAISQIVLLMAPWAVAKVHVIQEDGSAQLAVVDTNAVPLNISLAATLQLRMIVTGKVMQEVEPLEPAILDGVWQLHPGQVSKTQSEEWRQDFMVEPLQPGKLTLVIPPLRYRDGDGPWHTVVWKPIVVNVTTTVRPDVKDLRDITSPEDLPYVQPNPGRNVWFWLPVIGTALVLLIVTAVWRRRKRDVATLSPAQLAQRELDRVASLGLPSAGKTVEFHFLVHDVVRRYLKRRYHISGRCSTTNELLRSLRDADVSADRQAILDEFFQRCEPARFSGRIPSTADCAKTVEIARQITD